MMKKSQINFFISALVLIIISISLAQAESSDSCINEQGQSICTSGTCKSDGEVLCGNEGKSFTGEKCYCRPECTQFGDCCSDYFELCQAAVSVPTIRDLEVTVPSKFNLTETQTAVVKNYSNLRIKLVSVPETLGPQDVVSVTVTNNTESVSKNIRHGESEEFFGLDVKLSDTKMIGDIKLAFFEISLAEAEEGMCDSLCGADDFEQCPPCVQDHCLDVLCRPGKCKKDCDRESNKFNASVPSTFYLRISQAAHLTNHKEMEIKLDTLSSNATNQSGVPIAVLDISLPGGCGPGANSSCIGPPAKFYDDEELKLHESLEIEELRIDFQSLIDVTSNGTKIFKAQFHVSKLIENMTPAPNCAVEPRNANCTCGPGFKKQVKPKINGTVNCPPGQHKNPQGICVNNTVCLSHQHVGPGGECINNTNGTVNCPPGKLKDPLGNCVECLSDANCQSGKKCESGNCVTPSQNSACPTGKFLNQYGNCGPQQDLVCPAGQHLDATGACVKDIACIPGSGRDTNNYCVGERYVGGPDDVPSLQILSGSTYVEAGQYVRIEMQSEDPKRPSNLQCIVGPANDIIAEIAAGHCPRERTLVIDWGDSPEAYGGMSVGGKISLGVERMSTATSYKYNTPGTYDVKVYSTFSFNTGQRLGAFQSVYSTQIKTFKVKVAPANGRPGVVVAGTNLYARVSDTTVRKKATSHANAIAQGAQNAPIVVYELNTIDDKPATVTGIKFGTGLFDALSVKRMKVLNSNGQELGSVDWGAPVIRGCDWWKRYNYITIPHGPISIQFNQPLTIPAGTNKVPFAIAVDVPKQGSWFNGVQFSLRGVAVDGNAIGDNLESPISTGENIAIDGCFDANGDCNDDLTRAACAQNVKEEDA